MRSFCKTAGTFWTTGSGTQTCPSVPIGRPEDAKRGLYLLDQVYELMYQVAKK